MEKKVVFYAEEEKYVPFKKNFTDAGWDLKSNTDSSVPKKGRELISTGVRVEIPKGYVGIIKPRSGLAVKNGIDVGAGVIDSDYRGEIKILLFNNSGYDFYIKKGDRIAQIIVIPCILDCKQKIGLPTSQTQRGKNGFGSSGI